MDNVIRTCVRRVWQGCRGRNTVWRTLVISRGASLSSASIFLLQSLQPVLPAAVRPTVLLVCLSVMPLVCLSVILSVCLFNFLSFCQPVVCCLFMYVCLSAYYPARLSFHLSAFLTVCRLLSLYACLRLSVCYSVSLSFDLSIFLPFCLLLPRYVCVSVFMLFQLFCLPIWNGTCTVVG